jgi:general L-amino acid transport system permease protein
MNGENGSGERFIRFVLLETEPRPKGDKRFAALARWLLAGGWTNIAVTAICLWVIWAIVPPLIRFLVVDAVWTGRAREDCLPHTVDQTVGACWPFIGAKLVQLVYGFYPSTQLWRVNLVFLLAVGLLIPLLVPSLPFKRVNAVALFAGLPVVGAILLLGGAFGLARVPTDRWGGLLVTLVIALTGIVASLPLGILLALGRRSQLPIVRTLSIAFIEFWRGVPLITVLFFATYVLPLFLPGRWNVDALLRALIGVALFSSAAMAEVVRGGVQAIPRAQYEGALVLGLGYWQMMSLVILPQAIKLVIPGIVNVFISLFKDTTLVQIVAILDFLGQIRAAFADPTWAAPNTLFTGFAFAGMVYFGFCFGMSRYSRLIERRIGAARHY